MPAVLLFILKHNHLDLPPLHDVSLPNAHITIALEGETSFTCIQMPEIDLNTCVTSLWRDGGRLEVAESIVS